MADIGIIGTIVSGAFSLMGAMTSANALNQQAAAVRQASEYNAKLQEQKAMEERAGAQRRALATRDKKDLALSTLQARAAASGGGAGINDPTVISLAGELEGQGEYLALSDMFVGESRGRGLENQASADRYIGELRARASEKKADAAMIGGIGGLFGKYGAGGGNLRSPGYFADAPCYRRDSDRDRDHYY